jgi:tetratricopeptide (TPR) repeat protein
VITSSITDSAVKAAIAALDSESATTEEKIEMLIEMAQSSQQQQKTVKDLRNAVSLYYRAYELCGDDYPLLKARSQTGMSGALRTIPDVGADLLLQAKIGYEEALPIFQKLASKEEVAEIQMNLGLVLQSLTQFNLARISDSIQAYQEALRVFTWQKYPQEYAILYNNIAIAYLSMPLASKKEYLHQGLAIQSFEVALKHITLSNYPQEYAMLQNNFGNALQYSASSHTLQNNLRAIAAYDEALKVRDPKHAPLEYANTISNKANALFNLPDDPENPEFGNPKNKKQALVYYQTAWKIFTENKQLEQAQIVAVAMQEAEKEIHES